MSDINIGALSEAINDKMDRDLNNRSDDSGLRKLVESYVNGTSWYKIFDEIQSDGTVKKWCEQGGHFSVIASMALQTVNLMKNYLNDDYNLQVSFSTTGAAYTSSAGANYCTACNKTYSSFQLYSYTATTLADKDWRAEGYIS